MSSVTQLDVAERTAWLRNTQSLLSTYDVLGLFLGLEHIHERKTALLSRSLYSSLEADNRHLRDTHRTMRTLKGKTKQGEARKCPG